MRIIDKYLDKYYTRKLINYIDDFISITYYLDKTYKFKDSYVEICLKEPNDKDFNKFYRILYSESLYHLMNFTNVIARIKKIIER